MTDDDTVHAPAGTDDRTDEAPDVPTENADRSQQPAPHSAPPPATGVPAADVAAERLREVDDAPVDEHVAIYEDVHRRLQEGLADLDEQ